MKVAVVVRAHQTTLKLKSSVDLMSGGETYDLFVTTNETQGQVETFGAVKLSHTIEILRALGDRNVSEDALFHQGDVVFTFLRASLPDYDFIILLEDDLHMPYGAETLDRLVGAIRSRSPAVDLVSVAVRRAEPTWWWYKDGQRRFHEPLAIFFPLVGMSVRAIDHVSKERIKEAAEGGKLVFCESFVPSVLGAQPGFSLVDANEVVSGLYNPRTFEVGLPYLLEDPSWQSGAEMFHPVYSVAEFLEKRFVFAKNNWKFRGFMNDLEHVQRVVPPQLKIEYAARCTAFITLEIMEGTLHRLGERLGRALAEQTERKDRVAELERENTELRACVMEIESALTRQMSANKDKVASAEQAIAVLREDYPA